MDWFSSLKLFVVIALEQNANNENRFSSSIIKGLLYLHFCFVTIQSQIAFCSIKRMKRKGFCVSNRCWLLHSSHIELKTHKQKWNWNRKDCASDGNTMREKASILKTNEMISRGNKSRNHLFLRDTISDIRVWMNEKRFYHICDAELSSDR